jgi:DNA ligase (NAD+)
VQGELYCSTDHAQQLAGSLNARTTVAGLMTRKVRCRQAAGIGLFVWDGHRPRDIARPPCGPECAFPDTAAYSQPIALPTPSTGVITGTARPCPCQ